MKYHALLKTSETGDLYEFDRECLDEIRDSIVNPYLKNQEFQFDGYFIEPSKVKRLVITQTNLSSKECVSSAYDRLSPGRIKVIGSEDCVFGDDRYSTDITKRTLEEVKLKLQEAQLEIKAPRQNNGVKKSTHNETIFLGYSYREADDEFVSGFKDLLVDKGFEVIDGKADGLGSISQAILEKISLSDIVVIVMTKRDKKENGKFTTSAWLLEEKGAALAWRKQVGMFVEEEIDDADIGGMQGDNQLFHFSRNNFLKVAMNFLRIVSKPKHS